MSKSHARRSFVVKKSQAKSTPLLLERLEDRMVLAAPGDLALENATLPSVASDAAGNYVVVGVSSISDMDIIARRFTAMGTERGDEFTVNTTTTGIQGLPSVAMDASGDFVVVWDSGGSESQIGGIYAQRFNDQGLPQGSEFQISTEGTNAKVAMDAGGQFVVTWDGEGEVMARRFDENGIPLSGDFQVNSYTTGLQSNASIGMKGNGEFVIAWQRGSGTAARVAAQRFDANGNALGGEFLASPDLGPTLPDVSVSANGSFVIAWWDEPGNEIMAQRFDASGNALGGSILVDTSEGTEFRPSVEMNADGGFVVAWNDTVGNSVWTRRFDPNGNPLGASSKVYLDTFFTESQPDLAMDATGGFVLAGYGISTESPESIFAVRFHPNGVPVWSGIQVEAESSMVAESNQRFARNAAGNSIIVWGFESDVFGQRYDALGLPVDDSFRVNTYTTDVQILGTVAIDADGDFVVAWVSVEQGSPAGNIHAQRFNANGTTEGGEFRVNSSETALRYNPSIAMDADGDFVIAWQTLVGSVYEIYARRYNAQGDAQGDEFRVNAAATHWQVEPNVAMDALGNFVVAWTSIGHASSGYGIFAQRYNSEGATEGIQFRVSNSSTQAQFLPSASMNPDGEFVIAWDSTTGIRVKHYNAQGAPQGLEQVVGSGDEPSVAINPDGDFTVVWRQGSNLLASRFDPTGTSMGDPFLVSQRQNLASPNVAMGTDGSAWVTWLNNDAVVTRTFTGPNVAAAVTDVQVRGTNWGLDWFSYESLVGSTTQLRALPWNSINQLRLEFNQNVFVGASDLGLLGVNLPDYAGRIIDFAYDTTNFTATWTFSESFTADKLRIDLADGEIVGTNGLAPDGEWTDSVSTFPSGDGIGGGAFLFRINVLPGDFDGNGVVTALDWNAVRARLFTTPGSPNYSVFADINGSAGAITALDWNLVRSQLFQSLPSGEPGTAILSPALVDQAFFAVLDEDAVSQTRNRNRATSGEDASTTWRERRNG